jgi:antitoxin Phd
MGAEGAVDNAFATARSPLASACSRHLYRNEGKMYALSMATELSVTDARERFSEVVETAEREPVFLTKHGRRQAVVLSAAQYDRMLEIVEDAEDLATADTAMAAIVAGEPTIPWEDVKRDLGLA